MKRILGALALVLALGGALAVVLPADQAAAVIRGGGARAGDGGEATAVRGRSGDVRSSNVRGGN